MERIHQTVAGHLRTTLGGFRPSWGVVRLALGGLLLFAAVMKLLNAHSPQVVDFYSSRTLLSATVICELLLSAWLFSGQLPKLLYVATALTFVGFVCFSVYLLCNRSHPGQE